MRLPRRISVQRWMPGRKISSKLIRRWMAGWQVRRGTMPRGRSRRFGSRGVRRHNPPPVRTALQFVNHLHRCVRVAARDDRYLRHRSVAAVPDAIRPDLQTIESQIRSPSQMGLDRGLDLSSGIHLAGVASERENQRCQGSGPPPHRFLHGNNASASERLPKPGEPIRARPVSPRLGEPHLANPVPKSPPCPDRPRPWRVTASPPLRPARS